MQHFMKFIALAVALVFAPMSSAQAQAAGTVNAADVATMDGIIAALYGSISGPKGQARQWDRFRGLFHADARLIPTGANGATVLSVEDYVKRADSFFIENGFYEEEIGRKTDRLGNVVQLFSTYISKRAASDPEPFARGINSIQLLHHNDRWWIMNIFWQGETPDTPIPAEYIGNH